METETKPSSTAKFISEIRNQAIIVKLRNGIEYEGKLCSIDGYMNIVLEDSKEIVKGVVTATFENQMFLKGNNVYYISLP